MSFAFTCFFSHLFGEFSSKYLFLRFCLLFTVTNVQCSINFTRRLDLKLTTCANLTLSCIKLENIFVRYINVTDLIFCYVWISGYLIQQVLIFFQMEVWNLSCLNFMSIFRVNNKIHHNNISCWLKLKLNVTEIIWHLFNNVFELIVCFLTEWT